ncbi:hypothetical protein HB_00038 [Paenibacillus phage HB10c2]|uniref:Uncharacterized protein n=1 Tax=Paenibacillus phage HB10c2 TaxID=1589749 RepID=A0A0B5A5S8_9CAUD|nr:hypothetical protein AVV26_gp38 [Paenibacillus phage HB10c2]AJD83050.1 hypothetical protein HB_00038 [Paenibacillus phage HB10c2]
MKKIEGYITANNPLEDEMDLFRAILDVCIDLKKSISPTEATIRILEIKNYFHEKKATAATKAIKPPRERAQLEKKELQEIFEGNEKWAAYREPSCSRQELTIEMEDMK